ncbi:serine protease [Methylocystis sp. ATCC 49242]|uniref:trypsin-like serine peptidase n=1 Tax=Methylocystis sp. ATCC 49242 TaxID=622637 RepID=UPI0001F869E2|nr:hypothetical protein [Methylocystis sp. ATCC 49242]
MSFFKTPGVGSRLFQASAAVFATTLLASGAFAQAAPPLTAPGGDARSTENYWTADRIRNAKPIELVPGPGHRLQPIDSTAAAAGPSQTGAGAPPTTEDSSAIARRLHPPMPLTGAAPDDAGTSRNTSSYGAHFTTSRVFPDAATTTYPYVTTGRLAFRNPRTGRNSVCSASVLRPRVLVTAGHCVYHAGPTSDDPSTNKYFYSNWVFIPAYNNGAAPKGTWTPAWVIVSGYWSGGNGSVPNQQDVAMMEMRDNTAGQKISAFTGYLGYSTGGLSPNHLTIIGYPCNLDNCAKMQNTTAESFANGGSNTVTYGSAQRGGTSGGPWIQDFGVAGAGSPSGTARNWLKSVSSYGPVATEPKYLGGSILMSSGTSSFIDLLNKSCAHRAGNC